MSEPTHPRRLHKIFFADTTCLRFILICVALGWALVFATPGDTLTRPAYRMMGALFNEETWTVLYGGYAIFAMVRMATGHALLLSLLVNIYGLALFAVATASFAAASLFPVPPTIATEIGMTIAAFWVLIRTFSEDD